MKTQLRELESDLFNGLLAKRIEAEASCCGPILNQEVNRKIRRHILVRLTFSRVSHHNVVAMTNGGVNPVPVLASARLRLKEPMPRRIVMNADIVVTSRTTVTVRSQFRLG